MMAKRPYMKILTLFFLTLISLQLNAASLDDLIKSTWAKNPLLHQQQELLKSAELDRFARFLPNNPTISYSDADNQSWKTYGVSLLLGMPGKAFALHQLDKARVSAEEREVNAKKIELASFIIQLYTNCASTKELLNILDEAVTELDTLKQAITSRYEMGQSTQAERIGIELQYRQANIEFNSLTDQSKVACEKFTNYLNENELDQNLVSIKLEEDLSPELIQQMGDVSLDVIRSTNEEKLAEAEADTAFWKSAPDFTISYYRNYYNVLAASPIIPTKWTNTYMVSINLPLLFPFYERNEIRKEKAMNMIASQRAKMRKIESEKSVFDAINNFKRNRDILSKLINHDLPMAETMVDSTFAAYKQGKLGFSELILAKRTWLDLKKEEVNLKVSILNSRLICLNSCERK